MIWLIIPAFQDTWGSFMCTPSRAFYFGGNRGIVPKYSCKESYVRVVRIFLYRSVLSDVTAWHGIHFHKIINEIFWFYETIMWIFKIKCFGPPRILNELWCIYFCLQIPPRENWFQCVRRVDASAINFSYISTLDSLIFLLF